MSIVQGLCRVRVPVTDPYSQRGSGFPNRLVGPADPNPTATRSLGEPPMTDPNLFSDPTTPAAVASADSATAAPRCPATAVAAPGSTDDATILNAAVGAPAGVAVALPGHPATVRPTRRHTADTRPSGEAASEELMTSAGADLAGGVMVPADNAPASGEQMGPAGTGVAAAAAPNDGEAASQGLLGLLEAPKPTTASSAGSPTPGEPTSGHLLGLLDASAPSTNSPGVAPGAGGPSSVHLLGLLDALVVGLRSLGGERLEERLGLVGRCDARLAGVRAETVAALAERVGAAHTAEVLRNDLEAVTWWRQAGGAVRRTAR